jgi:hypothetical protein
MPLNADCEEKLSEGKADLGLWHDSDSVAPVSLYGDYHGAVLSFAGLVAHNSNAVVNGSLVRRISEQGFVRSELAIHEQKYTSAFPEIRVIGRRRGPKMSRAPRSRPGSPAGLWE